MSWITNDKNIIQLINILSNISSVLISFLTIVSPTKVTQQQYITHEKENIL